MQIILIILEVFLPEIASKLGGPNALPLRRRLFRSGMWILISCISYLLIIFTYRHYLLGVRYYSELLSGYELASLIILSGTALILLLLSAMEPQQNQSMLGSIGQNISQPDSPLIQLSGVFGTDKFRSFRKITSAGWNQYFKIIIGKNPKDVWHIDIDGICLQISFVVKTGECILLCDKVEHHVQLDVHGFLIKPKLNAKLVDQTGKVCNIELTLKGWFTPGITVTIDGMPITEQPA